MTRWTAVLALLALPVLFYFYFYDAMRIDLRSFVVKLHLSLVEEPVIFLGDSIVQRAPLPSSICGHPVVNAGIEATSSKTYLPIARRLSWRGTLIVVAIGLNDAKIPVNEDFPNSYRELVDHLAPAPLMFAGITPQGSPSYDSEAAERENMTIEAEARARNAPFIDFQSAMQGNGLTLDGVHLSPEGYRLWGGALIPAVKAVLGCR